MASQREVQWQAPAATGLVVKHGFFHEPTPEPQLLGSWRRVASDPVLWCKGFRDEEDEAEAGLEAGRDGEVTSAGSDGESETVGSSQSSQSQRFEPHARTCSGGSEVAASESTGLAGLGEHERASSPWCDMSGSRASTPTPESLSDTVNQQPVADAVWCDASMVGVSAEQQGACQMAPGFLLIPCGYVTPDGMAWCEMPMGYGDMAFEQCRGRGPQQSRHRNPETRGDQLPSHVQRRLRGQRCMMDEDNVTDVRIEDRTTVMLRNLPNNYNRDLLLAMLDSEGFAGQYDFIYLPVDFRTHASLGYAFVNLVKPDIVPRFWQTFDGYMNWMVPSRKECFVSWCGPHQGYEAHVERYRSSPVMHPMVPDEYKPVVFKDGVRIAFPLPTRRPRVPRVRSYVRNHA